MANPFNSLYDGSGAFRVDVAVAGEKNYAANALTFENEADAEAYARDLYSRWTLLRSWRVVPVSTPEREAIPVAD